MLASLNHPNIAAIYGTEQNALILELVEGPTLAERIAQGAIPVDEAIAIARQIAVALEAAHEAGVVHRDLKPANIKVQEDGTVKVLDFGLAKAVEREAKSDSSESPTLTGAATRAGVILGTAAYMSPEQAKGKRVDRRADVWAFGAVLYEMLTGKRPFVGDDVSETLARVLMKEPDWDALPAGLSLTLGKFLRRCLEKDPKGRVRDIGDVRLAMDGVFEVDAPPPSEVPAGGAERRFGWPALGAALLLGTVIGIAFWSSRPDAPSPLARFVIDPSFEPVANQGDSDGLWRVPADGGEPKELTTPDLEQGDHLSPEILPGGDAVLFTILDETVDNAQDCGAVPGPTRLGASMRISSGRDCGVSSIFDTLVILGLK